MQLFYIDESGTGLKDRASMFFVLSALGIEAGDGPKVDQGVLALKRRLISYAKPEDFEIKGRDMRQGHRLFSSFKWDQRVEAIQAVARLIADLPCRSVTVVVDKRDLPEYISNDNDLYRIAFWRLLDELDRGLYQADDHGLLILDARSDLHSSVQDRRLIEAYRDWVANRDKSARFIELPFFGFSAFYAGLQLADFIAYLIDFVSRDVEERRFGTSELRDSFSLIRHKINIARIP